MVEEQKKLGKGQSRNLNLVFLLAMPTMQLTFKENTGIIAQFRVLGRPQLPPNL